jgi:hypothetical protein
MGKVAERGIAMDRLLPLVDLLLWEEEENRLAYGDQSDSDVLLNEEYDEHYCTSCGGGIMWFGPGICADCEAERKEEEYEQRIADAVCLLLVR